MIDRMIVYKYRFKFCLAKQIIFCCPSNDLIHSHSFNQHSLLVMSRVSHHLSFLLYLHICLVYFSEPQMWINTLTVPMDLGEGKMYCEREQK